MKISKSLMGVLLSVMMLGAGTAAAADVTTAVDVNSAYVWRGITFNDGVVVQPSVDVAAGNFGLNVWGNLDADDYDDSLDSGEFSEIDLTLTYGIEAGPVGLTAGYIEYLFPTTEAGGGLGTREVFLDASLSPADGISTGITAYYDFDEVEDYYLNVYMGYGLTLDSGLSIDAAASAGYAGDDVSADGEAGFHEYTLTLGMGYAITDMVSVSATVGYTDAIDDDVLPDVEDGGGQDVNFFGGAGIAVAF